MKNLGIILSMLTVLCLTSACQEEEELKLETGVSLELARQRKANISDVRYDLTFNIPEAKDSSVIGRAQIDLKLRKRSALVLDFKADSSQVLSLSVNGKNAEIQCEKEHIVVPRESLKRGGNTLEIDFVAGDQSLNRNDEYLYTLLVPERARTLFPCFDQPDLKAIFSLTLRVPMDWETVANGAMTAETQDEGKRCKTVSFEPTKPLSTYLFSFVAGKWQKAEGTRDGQTIVMYYRETDPQKTAQCQEIIGEVFDAIKWMEDYTGLPCPYPKYDFVVVPGFQFGGMEHPGAVLYNDKRLFLNADPTPAQITNRSELIGHETAHLWFGDGVTMEWFNDVWTKEVFANYFGAQMAAGGKDEDKEQAQLNELKNFYIRAYEENRTKGATSVKQELLNLEDAGLIYGNMVYYKAPIVMRMLMERLGKDKFQEGLREYLRTYMYGNATWEDLVSILDRYTDEDLVTWSNTWVNEKEMPKITCCTKGRQLIILQEDHSGKDLVWKQNMDVMLVDSESEGGEPKTWTLNLALDSARIAVTLPDGCPDDPYVFMNASGRAYGFFDYSSRAIDFILKNFNKGLSLTPVQRLSLLVNIYENCVRDDEVMSREFAETMLDNLQTEQEPCIISASLSYLRTMMSRKPLVGNPELEKALWQLAKQPHGKGCQQTAFETLVEICRQPDVIADLYKIWETRQPYEGLALGETDYMKLAYELAVRLPDKYETLRSTQSQRISDPDRLREFQFVVPAVAPDKASRDSLFNSLLVAENRRVEPWATQALSYLNHPLREQASLPYIRPALDILQEVQRTGDIFFPKNWVTALLAGHTSYAASIEVRAFLEANPDYPQLLKNKLLQAADHLLIMPVAMSYMPMPNR
ncbi:MAG: M1 family aminopeptidase [Prevotellaceae bacterium]|nr:M1 family aminopeptidase [Prevotellaceae bacterium]